MFITCLALFSLINVWKGWREEEEKREGQKEEKKEGRERGKERKGLAIFSRQAYSQPPLAECLVNQSSFNPSFFQT